MVAAVLCCFSSSRLEDGEYVGLSNLETDSDRDSDRGGDVSHDNPKSNSIASSQKSSGSTHNLAVAFAGGRMVFFEGFLKTKSSRTQMLWSTRFVSLSEGCVRISKDSSDASTDDKGALCYNVSDIESVSYTGRGKTDFNISFGGNKPRDIIFRAASGEECEIWLQYLLQEFTNHAGLFERYVEILKEEEGENEKQIEKIMLQTVKLWKLAVGENHENTAKALEALGAYLQEHPESEKRASGYLKLAEVVHNNLEKEREETEANGGVPIVRHGRNKNAGYAELQRWFELNNKAVSAERKMQHAQSQSEREQRYLEEEKRMHDAKIKSWQQRASEAEKRAMEAEEHLKRTERAHEEQEEMRRHEQERLRQEQLRWQRLQRVQQHQHQHQHQHQQVKQQQRKMGPGQSMVEHHLSPQQEQIGGRQIPVPMDVKQARTTGSRNKSTRTTASSYTGRLSSVLQFFEGRLTRNSSRSKRGKARDRIVSTHSSVSFNSGSTRSFPAGSQESFDPRVSSISSLHLRRSRFDSQKATCYLKWTPKTGQGTLYTHWKYQESDWAVGQFIPGADMKIPAYKFENNGGRQEFAKGFQSGNARAKYLTAIASFCKLAFDSKSVQAVVNKEYGPQTFALYIFRNNMVQHVINGTPFSLRDAEAIAVFAYPSRAFESGQSETLHSFQEKSRTRGPCLVLKGKFNR